ncbi:hypothetical protein EON73_03460 [bacterium]|nr:MAG: hypothetical protein EON73_03460 [bacterium]
MKKVRIISRIPTSKEVKFNKRVFSKPLRTTSQNNKINMPSFFLSSFNDYNYYYLLDSSYNGYQKKTFSFKDYWTISFIPHYNNFWALFFLEDHKINYIGNTGQLQNKMKASRRRSIFAATQIVERLSFQVINQINLLRKTKGFPLFVSRIEELESNDISNSLKEKAKLQQYKQQKERWLSSIELHPSQKLVIKLYNWSSSIELKRYWFQLFSSFFDLCGDEARWHLKLQPIYNKSHNGLRKKKKRRL